MKCCGRPPPPPAQRWSTGSTRPRTSVSSVQPPLLLRLGCLLGGLLGSTPTTLVQGVQTQKWVRQTDDDCHNCPPPTTVVQLIDCTIVMKYGAQGTDRYQCTDNIAQMVHQGLQECVTQYASSICQLSPTGVQLGSASCAGTNVNITNHNGQGYLDFSGTGPTEGPANICVARIIESTTCLQWMQNQYFASSNLASINYQSDITFATPAPTPFREILPPTQQPSTNSPIPPPSTAIPTREPTIDIIPTIAPTFVEIRTDAPTPLPSSDAPSTQPTLLPPAPSSLQPSTSFGTNFTAQPLPPITEGNITSANETAGGGGSVNGVVSSPDETSSSSNSSGSQQQSSFPMIVGAIAAGTVLVALLAGMEVHRRRKNTNNNESQANTSSDSSIVEGGGSSGKGIVAAAVLSASSPSLHNNKDRSLDVVGGPSKRSVWFWNRGSTSRAANNVLVTSPAITMPLSDDELIGEYYSDDDDHGVEFDRSLPDDLDASGTGSRRLGIAPLRSTTNSTPSTPETIGNDRTLDGFAAAEDDVEEQPQPQPIMELDVQSTYMDASSSMYCYGDDTKSYHTNASTTDATAGRSATSLRLISMVDVVDEAQSLSEGVVMKVDDDRVVVTTGRTTKEEHPTATPTKTIGWASHNASFGDVGPTTTTFAPAAVAEEEEENVAALAEPHPPTTVTSSPESTVVNYCTALPLTTCVDVMDCSKPTSLFQRSFFSSLYNVRSVSSNDNDMDDDNSSYLPPAAVSPDSAERGGGAPNATADFDLDPSWNPDDNSIGMELEDNNNLFVVSMARPNDDTNDNDQQGLLVAEGYRTTSTEARSSQLLPLGNEEPGEAAAAPVSPARGGWGFRPRKQPRRVGQRSVSLGCGSMVPVSSSKTTSPAVVEDSTNPGDGAASSSNTTCSV